MRDFFGTVAAVFLALGTALTADGNSSLGCFAVRWWPWFRGWMRAVSSSICRWASRSFWRSSSRYSGIVFVVIARASQTIPVQAVLFWSLRDKIDLYTRGGANCAHEFFQPLRLVHLQTAILSRVPDPRSVHSCSDTLFPQSLRFPEREKTMPHQDAKKPAQSETRTKENVHLPVWKGLTLADLLQRLSVSSANPSFNR
jgi:hypothetical protein